MTLIKGEPLPKYEQVYAELKSRVQQTLQPHQLLPGERELSQEFEVSRVTVRRALMRLADEGLVYRIQGSGTYVSETGMVSKSLHLASFSEDMRERGLTPSAVVLGMDVVAADVDVAGDLRIPPGSPVFHLRRLRLANQVPMALEEVQIPEHLVPGLGREDLRSSLYEIMRGRYNLTIERALQRIRAVVVNEGEAAQLKVAPYSPGLLVHRVGGDKREAPIERATTLYRGDRYEFQFTASRDT